MESECKGRRLLDVGCGDGRLLDLARRRGWAAAGCDADQALADFCRTERGLNVETCDFSDLPDPERVFDVVALRYCLEHMKDPADTLRRCLARLAPEGRVFVRTPNREGFAARLFGRRWFQLRIPGHLHFFSPDDLRRLAAENGIEALSVSTPLTLLDFADSGAGLFSFLDPDSVRSGRGITGGLRRVLLGALSIAACAPLYLISLAGRGASIRLIGRKSEVVE